jgi:hypothetical protein
MTDRAPVDDVSDSRPDTRMSVPEFAAGDTVHYRGAIDHPEKGYPVQVREIFRGMFGSGAHLNGEPDNRVFYSLRGHGCRNPERRTGHWAVITYATGRSILESNLYQPPAPADADNDQ